MLDVVRVLAGNRGVYALDADAVDTMALLANGGDGCGRCADRLAAGFHRFAAEISSDVLDVLFRQRYGMRMHGGVAAVALRVSLQRRDDVLRVLATQLG